MQYFNSKATPSSKIVTIKRSHMRESDLERVKLIEDSVGGYEDEDSLMGGVRQRARSMISSDQDLKQAREDLGEYSDSYDEIRRATLEDAGKETEEIGKDEERDIVVDIDGGVDQSVMMYAAAEAGYTPVLDPDEDGETGTVFINGWRIEEDNLVSLGGAGTSKLTEPSKIAGVNHSGVSKRTEVMEEYFKAKEEFGDGSVPLPEVMEVSLPYEPKELDVPTYDAHNPEEALDRSEDQSIEGDLSGGIEGDLTAAEFEKIEERVNADNGTYTDELSHLDDEGPTSTADESERDDYRAVIRDQEQLVEVIDYLSNEHTGRGAV